MLTYITIALFCTHACVRGRFLEGNNCLDIKRLPEFQYWYDCHGKLPYNDADFCLAWDDESLMASPLEILRWTSNAISGDAEDKNAMIMANLHLTKIINYTQTSTQVYVLLSATPNFNEVRAACVYPAAKGINIFKANFGSDNACMSYSRNDNMLVFSFTAYVYVCYRQKDTMCKVRSVNDALTASMIVDDEQCLVARTASLDLPFQVSTNISSDEDGYRATPMDTLQMTTVELFDSAGLDTNVSVDRILDSSDIDGPVLCREHLVTTVTLHAIDPDDDHYSNCVDRKVPMEVMIGQPTYMALKINPESKDSYNFFPYAAFQLGGHCDLLYTDTADASAPENKLCDDDPHLRKCNWVKLNPVIYFGQALVATFQGTEDQEITQHCTSQYCTLICTLYIEKGSDDDGDAKSIPGSRRRLVARAERVHAFKVRSNFGQRPLRFSIDFDDSSLNGPLLTGSDDDVKDLKVKFGEALGEQVFNFAVQMIHGKPYINFEMYTTLTINEIMKRIHEYKWYDDLDITICETPPCCKKPPCREAKGANAEIPYATIAICASVVLVMGLMVFVGYRNRPSRRAEKKVVPWAPNGVFSYPSHGGPGQPKPKYPKTKSMGRKQKWSEDYSSANQMPSQSTMIDTGNVSLFHLARAMAMVESAREVT